MHCMTFSFLQNEQKMVNSVTMCILASFLLRCQQWSWIVFVFLYFKSQHVQLYSTLESGIDIAPVINVVPSLRNFHIRILIHILHQSRHCDHFSGFFSIKIPSHWWLRCHVCMHKIQGLNPVRQVTPIFSLGFVLHMIL